MSKEFGGKRMQVKKHALVIGGTGMLKNACVALARKGFAVSIIGRTTSKFQSLISESPPNSIFPIVADYNKEDVFDVVRTAMSRRGPFELIVSWSPNYKAVARICALNQGIEKFCLFQVKGSRRYFEDEPIHLPANCHGRKVFLGFILENGQSRWLTHDEISNGVIYQIETNQTNGIIGQIEPYNLRPQ